MRQFILLTAARNEEAFIEKTIRAVIAQTLLPKKWVIVSDGSVDGTDTIVNKYSQQHKFIHLLRKDGDLKRNFGSKAKAITFGYESICDLEFDYIGNLDADITMGPTYYEEIFSKFEDNITLGLAGGIRFDYCNNKFRRVYSTRNSVGGPFQLFRRACFEGIGGYKPLEYGGIDAVAEIMARMQGWQVESFPECKVYHHRCTGSAGGGRLKVKFRNGFKYYVIGYHPVFHVLRLLYNLRSNPRIIGAITSMLGYSWAAIRKYEKVVPDDVINYLRREQVERMQSLFFSLKRFRN